MAGGLRIYIEEYIVSKKRLSTQQEDEAIEICLSLHELDICHEEFCGQGDVGSLEPALSEVANVLRSVILFLKVGALFGKPVDGVIDGVSAGRGYVLGVDKGLSQGVDVVEQRGRGDGLDVVTRVGMDIGIGVGGRGTGRGKGRRSRVWIYIR